MTELSDLVYRRDLGGNYYELCRYERDYTARMITENRIEGLVRTCLDGRENLRYETGSMRSLQLLLRNGSLGSRDIRSMVSAIVRIFRTIKPYLLRSESLVFDPAYLYIDEKAGTPLFLYLPGYRCDTSAALTSLLRLMAASADQGDYEAVRLSYSLHQAGSKEDYVLDDLQAIAEGAPGTAGGEAWPEGEEEGREGEGEGLEDALYPAGEPGTEEDGFPGRPSHETVYTRLYDSSYGNLVVAEPRPREKFGTNLLTMGKKIFMINKT